MIKKLLRNLKLYFAAFCSVAANVSLAMWRRVFDVVRRLMGNERFVSVLKDPRVNFCNKTKCGLSLCPNTLF